MVAEELINYMVPPLKVEDDITRAKQWMDEFRVKELPVISGSELLGFISEELLYDEEIIKPTVGEYPLEGRSCVVQPNSHYYDVLKVLSEHEMAMVAVIDAANAFKGVVLVEDILKEFADTAIVNAVGAIVILRSSLSDYSLTEISRIVEMNESAILGANVKPDSEDPSLIEIVLRINDQDVNQICSGLAKAGYEVISSYNTEDRSFDERDRFGHLMKFLDP